MYSVGVVRIARFCCKGNKYLKVTCFVKYRHASEAQQYKEKCRSLLSDAPMFLFGVLCLNMLLLVVSEYQLH